MPKMNCVCCSAEFMWMPSQKSGKYCSSPCQITHRINEAIESGNYTRANAYTYFKRNTEYKCSCCGIIKWEGKELRLQIDHIDGNNANNIVENLRYLCPNCHTQTETWGVKNISEEGSKRLKAAAKLGNDIRNGRMPKGSKLVS
jgi:5-methylcytosine-specific restriction endonuclease McrA